MVLFGLKIRHLATNFVQTLFLVGSCTLDYFWSVFSTVIGDLRVFYFGTFGLKIRPFATKLVQ